MLTTLIKCRTILDCSGCPAPVRRYLSSVVVAAIVVLACAPLSFAQLASEFHRTLMVASAEPVTLDVEITRGDLEIVYGRDGQVSISAVAKAPTDVKLDDDYFHSV